MISAAVMPVQPRSSSRRSSGDARDGRRGSRETRRSRSSISMGTSDGDSGDSSGGGDGGGSGSTVWVGGGGGDVGRLWLAEDAGYLCVDLLLERTLEELAEGLAFAARWCPCLFVRMHLKSVLLPPRVSHRTSPGEFQPSSVSHFRYIAHPVVRIESARAFPHPVLPMPLA